MALTQLEWKSKMVTLKLSLIVQIKFVYYRHMVWGHVSTAFHNTNQCPLRKVSVQVKACVNMYLLKGKLYIHV